MSMRMDTRPLCVLWYVSFYTYILWDISTVQHQTFLNEYVNSKMPLLLFQVVHQGQIIGAILAETRSEAQRAATAVHVTYEVLEPIITIKVRLLLQVFIICLSLPLPHSPKCLRSVNQVFTCDLVTCVSYWYGKVLNVWFILRWHCAVDGMLKFKR